MNDPGLTIERLFLDASCLDYPLTRKIRERLSGTPEDIVQDPEVFLEEYRQKRTDPLEDGKRSLWLTRQKGAFIKPCPCTPHYLGCRYVTINLDLNCPLDCTYCILQLYLSNPLLTIFVNTPDLWLELDAFLSRRQGGIPVRIGTGELGDSLALDPITERSRELVAYFRQRPGALFELKTKSTHIQNLLDIDPAPNIVIAWSLNAPAVAQRDEGGAPQVSERIEAAHRVVERGFRAAFHFDPLIRHPGWQEGYAGVIRQLSARIPSDRIAWISLGALRFPPALKEIMAQRHPDSRLLYEEFIRGLDGKFRYFKPHRVEMLRFAAERIKEGLGREVPLYLCMESGEIWRRVLKKEPEGEEEIEGYLASPSGLCQFT
ncbi:MAG: radical SAM protein [Candidatus Aminicenantaceae bacterium]